MFPVPYLELDMNSANEEIITAVIGHEGEFSLLS